MIPSHRATFNGCWDYIYNNIGFLPGAYSAPAFWTQTFESDGSIPDTYEWTYEGQAAIEPGPSGWCEGSVCAQFFGGQDLSSSHALLWQWSNSATNGSGDYDLINASRRVLRAEDRLRDHPNPRAWLYRTA